jgi:hypothetical protein
MSLWLQDIEQMSADELEGLCEELEMKLDEGRRELTRKEEVDDDLITPDQIVLENRIDDMATWLGVKRD